MDFQIRWNFCDYNEHKRFFVTDDHVSLYQILLYNSARGIDR